MTYCPSCRVTLADTSTECPLCGGSCVISNDPVPEMERVTTEAAEVVQYPSAILNADQKDRLTFKEQRLIVVKLLSVSIGIILILTTGIDILFSRILTWSKYTSLILCMVWLFSAMPLLLWGKPWSVFSVLAPALPG